MTECPEQTAHSAKAGLAKEGHFFNFILFAEAEQVTLLFYVEPSQKFG